jgi:predicted NBD/HSP70 family sugar kinase
MKSTEHTKNGSRGTNGTRGIKRIDLAYVELASSENARDINRDIVLEIIRSQQPIARADLARSSGLQPSTISAIVEQLINEKWVSEGAIARRPRGRPSTLLSLNDAMVILVADIRPNHAIVALVDLNGRFLAREAFPLVSEPARAVAKIVQCMESMRSAHSDRSFEGIGISMPGRVDPDTQRLVLAPNLKWGNYDVKQAIESAMKLTVELDNDANACLLSELWSGRLDGTRSAVLVAIGEGVGTSVLANGQLIVGRGGLAGEFGHISMDPRGPECGCGQRGCWEMYASSRAAVRFYGEITGEHRAITSQELLRHAEDGDSAALEALNRQALHLGEGLRFITAALSPEVILITGDITTSWSRFGPVVESELRARMLAGDPPRLLATADAELARLRGAAAVVLQRHSGYHSSTHLAASGKRNRRKGAVAR